MLFDIGLFSPNPQRNRNIQHTSCCSNMESLKNRQFFHLIQDRIYSLG